MILIPLSPNVFNVINSVLLDVVACALGFHLTSEICGRLNSRATRTNRDVPLVRRSIPLLGGGLIATSRRTITLLTLVRLILFALIFAADFLTEGRTSNVTVKREAIVRTYGPPTVKLSVSNMFPLILLRRGCQSSDSEGFAYYGEIREHNGVTSCMTDLKLIRGDPVRFAQHLSRLNIDLRNDGCNITFNNYRHIHRCRHATVLCMGPEDHPVTESCGGVLQVNGKSYLCNGPSLHMDTQTGPSASILCREAINLNLKDDLWLDIYGRYVSSTQEAFDALFVSGKESRVVNFVERRDRSITSMYPAYLVIVGIEFSVLLVLTAVVLALHCFGFNKCASDENGLGTLVEGMDVRNSNPFSQRREAFSGMPEKKSCVTQMWFNRRVADVTIMRSRQHLNEDHIVIMPS